MYVAGLQEILKGPPVEKASHIGNIIPIAAYRMSKKGDWESPGNESITAAEGRDPAKDVPS